MHVAQKMWMFPHVVANTCCKHLVSKPKFFVEDFLVYYMSHQKTFGICDVEKWLFMNFFNYAMHFITFIWNCLCKVRKYDANFTFNFANIANLFIWNAYQFPHLKWCMCTSNSTNAWWNPTPSLMKCSIYIFMFLHFPCVWCEKSKDYASLFASMLEKTCKSWTWKAISLNLKKYIFWLRQFWWSWRWWFQVSPFSL